MSNDQEDADEDVARSFEVSEAEEDRFFRELPAAAFPRRWFRDRLRRPPVFRRLGQSIPYLLTQDWLRMRPIPLSSYASRLVGAEYLARPHKYYGRWKRDGYRWRYLLRERHIKVIRRLTNAGLKVDPVYLGQHLPDLRRRIFGSVAYPGILISEGAR